MALGFFAVGIFAIISGGVGRERGVVGQSDSIYCFKGYILYKYHSFKIVDFEINY